jgi:Leucine-rich repeat (LRR) protein
MRNQLIFIDEMSFKGLKKLRGLYLYMNDIEHLGSRTFEDLVEMEELFLDRNKIEIIPKNIFHKNSKLRILTLFKNKIFSIAENFLAGPIGIETVYLASNECVHRNFRKLSGDAKDVLISLSECFKYIPTTEDLRRNSQMTELMSQSKILNSTYFPEIMKMKYLTSIFHHSKFCSLFLGLTLF